MKKDWGKIAGGEGFGIGESNHPVDVPNKLLKYVNEARKVTLCKIIKTRSSA